MPSDRIIVADGWRDYALLDSGDGWKLERVGPYTFARPEPMAMWRPAKPVDEWNEDARFSPAAAEDDERGRWRFNKQVPESWPIAFDDIKLHARCTPFRHLGFFPEQSSHWRWGNQYLGPGSNVLNLFGYTGAASLYAARSGAKVTHVDASKKSIGQARENQALSGMNEAPIRWIADDALAFVKREARRGNTYDGVILDPPKHGRGPNGEIWQIEKDFPALLEAVNAILSPAGQRPAFVIATLYAVRLSFVALERAMTQTFKDGEIDAGEMTIPEGNGPEKSGRLLPTAIYARWLRR